MCGIAGRLGDAQASTKLIKEARELGNKLALSLKD
jgi:hypothetical protein